MTKTPPVTLLRSKRLHQIHSGTRRAKIRRICLLVIVLFLTPFLLSWLRHSFSADMAAMAVRLELWRQGVSRYQSRGDLRGWIRDQCTEKSSSTSEGCSCVVFLHGQLDNALIWKSILLWPDSEWAKMRLGTPLRLLALDLPESNQERQQATHVRETLASLCPRWVVVGHDQGGWVASWLALDWPSDMKALILIGLSKLKHEILVERLPSLTVPTLLLWGKEDSISPLSVGYEMRSSIRSAIWREISACGHWPQRDCPLPVIQSIIDMINYGTI